MNDYVTLSLETHLFSARIMKEHSLFLEAGFPCVEQSWIQKAEWFKQQFEKLLQDVVQISDERVGKDFLSSGEMLTEFTIPAERVTQQLTGIRIDSSISRRQQCLSPGCMEDNMRTITEMVHGINHRALELLDGLICFKEDILKSVKRGKLFTTNYPLLIEHIIREAKLYRMTIKELMEGHGLSKKSAEQTEDFWNRIMMEHALFIRGLLDPSEEELIKKADGFAGDYKEFLQRAAGNDWNDMSLTEETLAKTIEYRDFKTSGVEGILESKIASIIIPLLADHVLREANRYIRLLKEADVK